MTSFVEKADRKLAFPPRFGEHNQEIYGKLLGYSQQDLADLTEKKVI
jgi:crotonobetainyl-CoA:carnitine CoA-transferase CaiB-like acyl-CoA transferase